LRRVQGLRKTRPFLITAIEAMRRIGSSAWIRQDVNRSLGWGMCFSLRGSGGLQDSALNNDAAGCISP
jgi:hypothetical protein